MIVTEACLATTSRQNGQNIECYLHKLSRRSLLCHLCRDITSAHSRLSPALGLPATELFSFQPSFTYLSLFTWQIPPRCVFRSLDRSPP